MKMMQFKVGNPKGVVYDVGGSDDERLKKIQAGVGGYFTYVRLLDNYVALCDDEAMLNEKKPNIIMIGNNGAVKLLGDILVSKLKTNDDESEDFDDLTDEDFKFIQSRVSKISTYGLPIMMWSPETKGKDFWTED